MGAGAGFPYVENAAVAVLIVPFDALEADTLTAVIEDWLSRQAQESAVDMDTHSVLVQQVRDALVKGQLVLTWDEQSQTINIHDPQNLG